MWFAIVASCKMIFSIVASGNREILSISATSEKNVATNTSILEIPQYTPNHLPLI